MKIIYLVAVIIIDNESIKHSRTWGWYSNFEDAEKAVLENHTDIFEYSYEYAVIEKMPEGVCAVAEDSWWYKASYENDEIQIYKVQPPDGFENILNITF